MPMDSRRTKGTTAKVAPSAICTKREKRMSSASAGTRASSRLKAARSRPSASRATTRKRTRADRPERRASRSLTSPPRLRANRFIKPKLPAATPAAISPMPKVSTK